MSKEIKTAQYRLDIIALALAFVVQFGGVCWHASKLTEAVMNLNEESKKIAPLTSRIDKLETRVNNLEGRNDGIKDLTTKVNKIDVKIGELTTEVRMIQKQ